jgi:EAL domain-containing protein (putative c-di-GMP-specific phosphodiesterase class I)
MGLECVIEGVESQEELAALKRLGGRFVQGYVYARPLSESEVGSFLDTNSKLSKPLVS